MSNNQVGFQGITSNLSAVPGGEVGCTNDNVPTQLPSTTRVVGESGRQFLTTPVWDSVGCGTDNIVRVYNVNQCVYHNGLYYWSQRDGNISEPGVGEGWTDGKTICEVLANGGGGSGADAVNPVLLMSYTPTTPDGQPVILARPATTTNSLEAGGWVKQLQEWIVPKSGYYLADLRLQYSPNDVPTDQYTDRARGGLIVDGAFVTKVAGRGIDFGTGLINVSTMEKTLPELVRLEQGQKVGVAVAPLGADPAKAPSVTNMTVRLSYQTA